jgi:hypothetical protein
MIDEERSTQARDVDQQSEALRDLYTEIAEQSEARALAPGWSN